jgi:hypothetical protein
MRKRGEWGESGGGGSGGGSEGEWQEKALVENGVAECKRVRRGASWRRRRRRRPTRRAAADDLFQSVIVKMHHKEIH